VETPETRCAKTPGGPHIAFQVVRDLVAGRGLEFDDEGEHELKGVPERWRLDRVEREPAGA